MMEEICRGCRGAINQFNDSRIRLNDLDSLYSKVVSMMVTKAINKKEYLESLKKSKFYGPYVPQSSWSSPREFIIFSAEPSGTNTFYIALRLIPEKGSLRLSRRYRDVSIAQDFYFTSS